MTIFLKALRLSCVGAVLLGGYAAVAKTADIGELATPPGITIEPLGRDQGYQFGGGIVARERLTFANANGLTLYMYDKDPAGKSTCTEACAKDWLPALAPAKAKPIGAWSLITRDDKTKQWALQGKALYTSVKDVDPGSWYGNSPADAGPPRKNGAGVMVGKEPSYLGGNRREGPKETPLPEGWKIALTSEAIDLKLPPGFAVREVQDALGLALIDYRKRTLYYFKGDPNKDARPNNPWVPAQAPQFSQAVGDFNFIARSDGIRQWAYKGKGLYTYANEPGEGFADGAGIDDDWVVANIYRYYTPSNVMLQDTAAQGKILATAKGLTLYRREPHSVGQTHGLRRSQGLHPAIGRELGINVMCDADCRKVWRPYKAPDGLVDAQGQWAVVPHPDGFRQLAYQGYALWTYSGDQIPGETNGNDEYTDFLFSGRIAQAGVMKPEDVNIGTPIQSPAALYWSVVQP